MTNYANNSIKNREKNIEVNKKPLRGKAKVKEKSTISKIASSMINEEVKSIKEYAIYDVIIPVIKDTIHQLLNNTISMLFWGEVRNSPSSRRNSLSSLNATRVSYRDFYDDRRAPIRGYRESRVRVSYDDITFTYKEDAIEVLDRMDEILDQYGVVRVSDLFEMAGVTGNGPTDHNYGWTNISTATVERDRNGDYYIKMPRPVAIR